LATQALPLGRESTLMKTPAKMKNTIIIGGVTTYPISMLGSIAPIAVARKIAVMHSIITIRIKIRKL
jgi:hypothetical protein